MTNVPYTAQRRWPSPLGTIWAARTALGLAGLWFAEGQKDTPETLDAPTCEDDPLLRAVEASLDAYWQAGCLSERPPLDLHGTPFQRAVWQALLEVPLGQTLSYRDLAERIGRPQAVRAVGAAVGRNPVSILVPCHRIVGSDGSLTGYAGGLERKIALLRLEGVLAA
ncbi:MULTISPECIES: methylated-DNA--[protein]-cysteine S-methyltransferase [Caldimonas]|jgi:methylated-DNA-[protein]-cysteine S-methyltransferase|uniref:methylated-DNA--[protein]-cysteine S-methyltransferase n=1 Tax=Caldimonas TaxID=196013 RepID=UPI000382A47E|nr:methylated-DNA--[protein]-cysteine S-methyltransferase [Caldimonas manganoxidans]MCX7660224.1 methylated-DNA--[protein]-cysteine S-methyltransferase [Caldimonas manganoxidans]